MPTAKELALGALRRTSEQFDRIMEDFPVDRWQESPKGFANPLRGVLEHLVDVEGWWLINIGEPESGACDPGDPRSVASANELAEMLRAARTALLELLDANPDGFFNNPLPTCRYPHLTTGADLCVYMSQHDFYHYGQVEMLKMAFTEPASSPP